MARGPRVLRDLIGTVHSTQIGAAVGAETFLGMVSARQVHEFPEPVVHRKDKFALGPGVRKDISPSASLSRRQLICLLASLRYTGTPRRQAAGSSEPTLRGADWMMQPGPAT